MKYISTKGGEEKTSFRDALFQGLAKDGGLFVPENFPTLKKDIHKNFQNQEIDEIGAEILELFIDDIPKQDLRKIIKKSINFELPIKKVGEFRVFELFHGETMAFKDFAAKILSGIMEYYLLDLNKKILIMTATSGDTGAAVANGFSDKKNINVVVLFPKNKVSNLQYKQMTHVAKNIYPVEVNGSFDDCQKIVKQSFADESLKKYNITSANSINIGRLLAQVIYYFYAASKLADEDINFVVPTGNMGNATACFYAKMLACPIDKITLACNINDPLVEYFKTGVYAPKTAVETLSTAMDIGAPSNFERILYFFKSNVNEFKKHFLAETVTDTETIKTIKHVYKKYNYILDPHTAVAWAATEKLGIKNPVIVATASPIKFADEIEKATGIKLPSKKISFKKEKRLFKMENNYEEIMDFIDSLNQF